MLGENSWEVRVRFDEPKRRDVLGESRFRESFFVDWFFLVFLCLEALLPPPVLPYRVLTNSFSCLSPLTVT